MRLAASVALATFVSEDLAGISAGVLAASGLLAYPTALVSYFVGIVASDFSLFLLGRWMGRSALGRAVVRRLVTDDAVRTSAQWIERRGAQVVVASRFLPGTRLATYVACGFVGVTPWRFLGLFAIAAALWTPLVVAAAALPATGVVRLGLIGAHTLRTSGALLGAGTLLLAVEVGIRLARGFATYQTRRAWAGRWRRITRWEFWPMWCFYPPVIAYVCWLGLKHRGLTVFTACNPGILGGGFVGESKADILRRIAAVDGRVVPSFSVVPRETPDRLATQIADAHAARCGYPVVVKPDQGQRGEGVVIARTRGELVHALGTRDTDLILQRYVHGCEFGVFYYRRPDETSGHIFAVTEKQLPVVEGDGRRSLERLILDHPRAVALAQHYFRANAERLHWIPASGERVQLSELGVHSRGAIFRDGHGLLTPALRTAINQLASRIDGFNFGRFDLRSESVDAFRAGQFAVIELNGVTSEATSIYDARNSLWTAYRVLFAQWRIAFEIGAANSASGVRATSVRTLGRLALAYRQRSRRHAAGGIGVRSQPAGPVTVSAD